MSAWKTIKKFIPFMGYKFVSYGEKYINDEETPLPSQSLCLLIMKDGTLYCTRHASGFARKNEIEYFSDLATLKLK